MCGKASRGRMLTVESRYWEHGGSLSNSCYFSVPLKGFIIMLGNR